MITIEMNCPSYKLRMKGSFKDIIPIIARRIEKEGEAFKNKQVSGITIIGLQQYQAYLKTKNYTSTKTREYCWRI